MKGLLSVLIAAFLLLLVGCCCKKMSDMADEDYKACLDAGVMSQRSCYHYAYM